MHIIYAEHRPAKPSEFRMLNEVLRVIRRLAEDNRKISSLMLSDDEAELLCAEIALIRNNNDDLNVMFQQGEATIYGVLCRWRGSLGLSVFPDEPISVTDQQFPPP